MAGAWMTAASLPRFAFTQLLVRGGSRAADLARQPPRGWPLLLGQTIPGVMAAPILKRHRLDAERRSFTGGGNPRGVLLSAYSTTHYRWPEVF